MVDIKKHLKAALAAPESGVQPEATKSRAGSFAAQVRDLVPGEVATRAVALPRTISMDELNQVLPEHRENLRNNSMPAVRAAKALYGDEVEYSMEVTHFLSPAGTIYVIAIVTRVA